MVGWWAMEHELTPEDAALISSETAEKVKRETGHKGIETATVVGMSQSKGNVPYVIISVAAGRPGGTVLTVPSKTGQMFYPGQRVSIEWDPPAGCYVTGSIDLQPVPRVRASLLCGSGNWTLTTLNPAEEDPDQVTFSPDPGGITEVFTFVDASEIELFEVTGGLSAEFVPFIRLFVNGDEIALLNLYDPPVAINLDVVAGDEVYFLASGSPGDRIGGSITMSGFRVDTTTAWIIE